MGLEHLFSLKEDLKRCEKHVLLLNIGQRCLRASAKIVIIQIIDEATSRIDTVPTTLSQNNSMVLNADNDILRCADNGIFNQR